MTIAQEETAEGIVLRISGEMSLATAAGLRSRLLALPRGQATVLDLGEVEEMDLACLQLLVSAQRSWADRGAVLRIADSASAVWAAAAAAAGLDTLQAGPA